MYYVDPQFGDYGNVLSHFFDKNFVKLTFLLKKILKSRFDEFFLDDSKFFIFPHCETSAAVINYVSSHTM